MAKSGASPSTATTCTALSSTSHLALPGSCGYELNGPNAHGDLLIGQPDYEVATLKGWYGLMPGDHAKQNNFNTMIGITAAPLGSGKGIVEDNAVTITATKQDWKTTTIPGGTGALFLRAKGGGPKTQSNDTFALNTFTIAPYHSGFIQTSENVSTELGPDGAINTGSQSDIQQGVEDGLHNVHIGLSMSANIGAHTAAIYAHDQSSTSGRWGNLIMNNHAGIMNYAVSDTGVEMTQPDNSGEHRVIRANVNGVETFTNFAGLVLATLDQKGNFNVAGVIRGKTPVLKVVTTKIESGYKFTPADCNTMIRFTGASAATWTVPTGLSLGCNIGVIQESNATITFSAGPGETAHSLRGLVKTGGKWATVHLFVDTAATVILSGDLQ
ncbi:MAG: hypothetical protein ACRYGI_05385 [Janthinobacterium lividum]